LHPILHEQHRYIHSHAELDACILPPPIALPCRYDVHLHQSAAPTCEVEPEGDESEDQIMETEQDAALP
jgi:hypothetical protein